MGKDVSCIEHEKAKIRNKAWLRTRTIVDERERNCRNCPCVNKDCYCTIDPRHPFHEALVLKEGCDISNCQGHQFKEKRTVENEYLRERIEKLTEEINELKERIMTIRKISASNERQLEAEMQVQR